MSADPQRLTGLADRFTRSLARIERRAVRSLTVSLRRSLARVLTFLRSHYLSYINELGPQGYDPARNPIRRPGDYQVADAAGRFRPILLDVQQFMPEEEIRQWIAGYERDLREAARLGQQLGLAFARAMDRPAPGDLFNGVDPLVIRATAATTGAYVQGETAKFRSQLVDIVSEGATRGWGPKRLERSIRQALEGSKDAAGVTKRLGLRQRAELIARTELANVYSRGTLERARLQGSSYVRLLASNDERTCPICASRNGRVYPADRVAVPLHPRCVLGDTKVSPGPLAAAFRSTYSGHVVTVRLAGGESFTVTPNHPVLTPAGWLKAEFLREGDQLIGYNPGRDFRGESVTPDLHEVPATAEDVFTAFRDACAVPAVSVPVSPLDLHGDGAFVKGDVEVVRAKGLLQGYWHTEGGEYLGNEEGIKRRVRFRPLTSLGHADALLLWHSAAATGSVSRLGEALALLRGGLSHAEQHRIATAASRDPALVEEGGDRGPLYAELLGHGLDAASLLEGDDGGILVEDQACAGGSDAVQLHPVVDGVLGNPKLFGDLSNGNAGLVELSQVLSVDLTPFHGFVYTFETFSGTYATGTDVRIINRNCRCVLVPLPDEAVQEREGQTRDVLLDGERWRAEHERGIEAYAEAKGISLDQARIDLARALNTPTASEKRLNPTNPFPLPESVPLYPDPASSR